MSHWSQEEGWWLASDGNWYPPDAKPHHPPWRRRWVQVTAAIVLVAGGAAAYVVTSTDEDLLADDDVASSASDLAADVIGGDGDGETASGDDFELLGRSYGPGDCVSWDQTGSSPVRTSVVVPCDQPHLIEVSGSIFLPDGEFPTDDEWAAIERDNCRSLNEMLYGGPLDPSGSVVPTGLWPTEESWDMRERMGWCGLAQYDGSVPATLQPFTGTLRAGDGG